MSSVLEDLHSNVTNKEIAFTRWWFSNCNDKTEQWSRLSWWHFLGWNTCPPSHVSEEMAKAASSSCAFPQHTAGLLLIVAGRTSARLILFFISSHRHTRKQLVVSASYIFHGRQPQAQKSKAQCHHPGIQEIPESLSFITKIICEHKQMWSTNMPFNWEGRWSHHGRDGSEKGTVENKASAATTTLHFCRSNWETGSGVGSHKTQTEITIVASARHTDRAIHRNKLYWVSGGNVVYPLHHHCCVCLLPFSFDSFGNEATYILNWNPKCKEILGEQLLKTQHLHWNEHSKDSIEWSSCKSSALVVAVIWGIPPVEMLWFK